MNRLLRVKTFAVTILLALVVGPGGLVAALEKVRNPFNVKDVPNPDGPGAKAFADRTQAHDGTEDANATAWGEKTPAGSPGSLEGEWSSRWNAGTGVRWTTGRATVKASAHRVYILYQDRATRYLIDARRDDKNRLVGRYMNLKNKAECGAWVGFVIDDERIDGYWTGGRWDLRRSCVAEKKAGE